MAGQNEEKRALKGPGEVHNVTVEGRRRMSISGVYDVDSFDEKGIVLFTSEGVMEITGESLHINRLNVDTGEVSIEGELYAISYSDEDFHKKGSSFLSRIFK